MKGYWRSRQTTRYLEILHKKLRRPLLRRRLVGSWTNRVSTHWTLQSSRLWRHETHSGRHNCQQTRLRREHVTYRDRKVYASKWDQESLSCVWYIGDHGRRSTQSFLTHDRDDQGESWPRLIVYILNIVIKTFLSQSV